MGHFVSECCKGEKCTFWIIDPRVISSADKPYVACGHPATHKVGEEMFEDDPNPIRHNLTAYVCCAHYCAIMGVFAARHCFPKRPEAA